MGKKEENTKEYENIEENRREKQEEMNSGMEHLPVQEAGGGPTAPLTPGGGPVPNQSMIPPTPGQVQSPCGQIPPVPGPMQNPCGQIPSVPEPMPNRGGQVPSMSGPMPNQGGQVPPMSGAEPMPNQGGQVPSTSGPMPNQGGQMPPQNRMPYGGQQGYYGYRNPYQNNWQNQRYYGNDRNRNWAGYNNYPNQNYGTSYGPQGGSYDYRPGNYGAGGNAPGDGGEKKKMSTGKKVLAAVCICAALLLGGSGIYYGVQMLNDPAQDEAEQASAQPENPQIGPVDLDVPEETAGGNSAKPSAGALTDVSDLVERIMPSVVSVNAVYSYSDYYWGDGKYDGGGSGFIIGENETELLIATNAHVVTDTEDLKVSFVDETEVDARVKGHDKDLDVAVIAVRLEDIPQETKEAIAVARLGDSTTLRAGQAVISIGNALLLGQSVTTGIVSATNAPVGGGYDEMGNQYGSDDRVMIQTTAFMNPGCSGGVLVNASGEVVGINTMTINSSDVEGMCYAIPITDAIPVLDKLKTREIRERLRESESGYLGISCSNVEGRQAEEYDIPKGVYVRDVEEGGAAEKAGLKKGDVIVALNEVPVETMDELSEMLRYYPVDEIVDLEVMRYQDGEYKSQIISVKLGKK